MTRNGKTHTTADAPVLPAIVPSIDASVSHFVKLSSSIVVVVAIEFVLVDEDLVTTHELRPDILLTDVEARCCGKLTMPTARNEHSAACRTISASRLKSTQVRAVRQRIALRAARRLRPVHVTISGRWLKKL